MACNSKDGPCDTYANSYVWSNTTGTDTLYENLLNDKKECDEKDRYVMWYHGKMSRPDAEKILFEAMARLPNSDSDGMFLVRDSTASDVNFSLSFLKKSRCYHYSIQRMKEGCHYFIEEGPRIHGLDKLIEHYMADSDLLPTRLSNLCKGTRPPPSVRKNGPTNLLHQLVRDNDEEQVENVLNHELCPDINAKNEEGSTALHDAASLGYDKCVSLLLEHEADIKMKDAGGSSPLHVACAANRVSICKLLIAHDNSCVQDKIPYSDWVPLHTAAMHGHTECVEVLLNARAAINPRSSAKETPVELAMKFRRGDSLQLLENHLGPRLTPKSEDWTHPEMERKAVEHMLQSHGLADGLFMVSRSKKGHYRLSLCNNMSFKHYRITDTDYRGHTVFYIDDGPYHYSIADLVEYYQVFEDGLPVKLKQYVSTAHYLVELKAADIYLNLPKTSQIFQSPVPKILPPQPLPFKPQLPPRPTEIESPVESPKSVETPPSIHRLSSSMEAQNRIQNSSESPTLASPAMPPCNKQEPLKVISRKHLKIGCELGTGEYGSVLKGVLDEGKKKLFVKKKPVVVAIKTFHSISNEKDFKQEAHVMQSLQHDYIVQLLGVVYDPPPYMLVEEYLPMGSMLTFLEDYPAKVRVKEELYLWAAQIAEGMMYLETKRLVHRDLAARNILLLSLEHVKISDFGLSRAMGFDKEYYKASKGGRWPVKWYAPESVNYGHFSHASDVWSYGVTLWEMFSYAIAPYDDMTGVQVIKYIEDGNRMDRPETCPFIVYDVMLKCWSYTPSDRPTFSWLNKQFEELPEFSSTRSQKQRGGKK